MGNLIGVLGRSTIHSLNRLMDLCALTYRLLAISIQLPHTGRVLIKRVMVEQIYFTAVQALPVIIPVALIIGSLMIVQFSQLSGQVDLGKLVVLLMLREIGPMITAIVVILRSATAVTIETSYMRVLNEIETLEMAGIDPMRTVCLPRLMGITSAVVSLVLVFDLTAIIGGYAVVRGVTGLPVEGFIQQIARGVEGTDIVVGLLKGFFFGITIAVTCLYHGLTRKSQITQVPVATSRAAMDCFFYCLVINIFISFIFYV
ncbi:ABC transporter permease [Desulfosarcina ovata subsp. sediminis]|uniref:ABC transporter permease n=1 Tax=Desulfosarcina ovata subsp. sediminis TaxID=885957 RepID=A0A5K7ZWA0_9BACT|nr:ABC transporter permease [Desulfosarcina ovata]BBO84390.1 ABC transporter permease [Desulfosarcina ovata subsp. sediminis]